MANMNWINGKFVKKGIAEIAGDLNKEDKAPAVEKVVEPIEPKVEPVKKVSKKKKAKKKNK